MKPASSPGPYIKAVLAFVFAIFNFSLFIAAAVAWSHHRDACWSDLQHEAVDRPLGEISRFVPCGTVRWFAFGILTAVSILGFFVVGGYSAAILMRPRDHQKGTCKATLLYLALLFVALVVGWTPPGHFNTIIIANPPASSLSISQTRASQPKDLVEGTHEMPRKHGLAHSDRLTKRSSEDRTLEQQIDEFIRELQCGFEKESEVCKKVHRDGLTKRSGPRNPKNKASTSYLSHMEKQREEEELQKHVRDTTDHPAGLHGVTGAFLFDTGKKSGAFLGAIFLAHLTFFFGALLAMVDCILPDGKPERDGEGKRDSMSSEM